MTHRRYVPYSHAHYAGNLVDGAYSLALFGDVATEVCIRTDGDEGLFASYSDVQFRAPVQAGDVRRGRRHRDPGRSRSRDDRASRRGSSAVAPRRRRPSGAPRRPTCSTRRWSPRPLSAPSSCPRRPDITQLRDRRVARSGHGVGASRPDTPKSVENPQGNLRRRTHPFTCGFVRLLQVSGRLTDGPRRRPRCATSTTGHPRRLSSATPRAGFGPRDGAMRKCRSVPGPIVGVASETGWGQPPGVRHGKGPTTQ